MKLSEVKTLATLYSRKLNIPDTKNIMTMAKFKK